MKIGIQNTHKAAWIGSFLALLSVVFAIAYKFKWIEFPELYGYILLGLWVIVPPIWFFCEYLKEFPKGHDRDQSEVERLKHLQDLARNIWLAQIILLTSIMGVKWPVG